MVLEAFMTWCGSIWIKEARSSFRSRIYVALCHILQGHQSEALNFLVALSMHSEEFKALALTPSMFEFLVESVQREAKEYMTRWAEGWKSRVISKSSAATLPASGTGVQGGGEEADDVSDGSWQTDEDASDVSWKTDEDDDGNHDTNRHGGDDDGVSSRRSAAGDNSASADMVRSSRPRSAPCLQDWEACEQRSVTRHTPQLSCWRAPCR